MEYIESEKNKTLKRLSALGQRKYREKYGEYILEGYRAVKDGILAGQIRSVFLASHMAKKNLYEELVIKVDEQGGKAYIVPEKIFQNFVQTSQSQGIIAIARKKKYEFESFQVKSGALYILLDRVQDPGNLGTVLRTAVAGGVEALFLTKGSVDLYNDKVVRSAMSAIGKIPIYENLDERQIGALLKREELHVISADLENSRDYRKGIYRRPLLLAFGNEGEGLSPYILEHSDEILSLPLWGPIESLNLGVAAGIFIYKAGEEAEYDG